MILGEERPGGVRKRDRELKPSTFDVIERQRHVNVFKVGKLWIFRYFFENKEIFEALLNYYNEGSYRFEFKPTASRNQALKLLERNGFDYDLAENLKGYVVKLPKNAKYAQIYEGNMKF